MPFIWNNSQWKLVDDQEQFDKRDFSVVRKLRITRNNRIPLSIDHIQLHLRKYGVIESVEILSENEAFVTFVCDRIAMLVQLTYAFDLNDSKSQNFEIEPAETWEQPEYCIDQFANDENIEQTSEMFILNHDCLLHLFQFLDLKSLVSLADVCQMFYDLLHQRWFPRIQEYTVNENDEVINLRRTMICIGRHITDLTYVCHQFSRDSVQPQATMRTKQFLRVIVQQTGSNVRRAKFSLILIQLFKVKLAPLLLNVESLTVESEEPDFYLSTIDVCELCPNLIEFKVNGTMRMHVYSKPWTNLKRLSIIKNVSINPNTFAVLIRKNPQLICVEFATTINRKIIPFIARKLPMLEKIAIADTELPYLMGYDIDSLKNLSFLREITLVSLKTSDQLKSILECLSTFYGLCKVVLHNIPTLINDDHMYGRSLVQLSKALPNLEQFMLKYIKISEKTFIDFVRFANNQMKIIRLHCCGLKFSDRLILKLFDTLQSYRPTENGPLQLYVDSKSISLAGKRLIENEEPSSYLKLMTYEV